MALPDEATLSDTYGGPYQNAQPVEDPLTEISADADNEALADTAGCTRMVPRAWVSFIGTTYTSGSQVITVTDHNAVWGGSNGVKPTIVQTSAGVLVITWPATVVDELGVTKTLNIRFPHKPVTVDATLSSGQVSAYTANTMTIHLFSSAGSANALNGIPVFCSWT